MAKFRSFIIVRLMMLSMVFIQKVDMHWKLLVVLLILLSTALWIMKMMSLWLLGIVRSRMLLIVF